jgi:hypothetical protein
MLLNKKAYVERYKFTKLHSYPKIINNYMKYIIKSLSKYNYKIKVVKKNIEFILNDKFNTKITYSGFDFGYIKTIKAYDKTKKMAYALIYYEKDDYIKTITYNYGLSNLHNVFTKNYNKEYKEIIFNYFGKNMSFNFTSDYNKIMKIKQIQINIFITGNEAKTGILNFQIQSYNINKYVYFYKCKYRKIYKNFLTLNKYKKFITLFLDSNYKDSFLLFF